MTAVAAFQLPAQTWAKNQHCVPTNVLQCALFSVGRPKTTDAASRVAKPLASLSNLQVGYAGPTLDQQDLTVWASCVQLAIDCQSYTFHVPARELLLETGMSKARILHASLARLQEASLSMDTGRYLFQGSLVKELLLDKQERMYTIELSPTIVELFRETVLLDRNIRKAFGRNALALWLYSFYSTWAEPKGRYSVATLHQLCGSDNGDLAGFRRDLLKALDLVAQQTGWKWWHVQAADHIHVRPAVVEQSQPTVVPAPLAVAKPARPIMLTPGKDYHLDPATLEDCAERQAREDKLLAIYVAQIPADKYPMLHRTLSEATLTPHRHAVATVVARCADTELYDAACREINNRLEQSGLVGVTKWLRKHYPRPATDNAFMAARKEIWHS